MVKSKSPNALQEWSLAPVRCGCSLMYDSEHVFVCSKVTRSSVNICGTLMQERSLQHCHTHRAASSWICKSVFLSFTRENLHTVCFICTEFVSYAHTLFKCTLCSNSVSTLTCWSKICALHTCGYHISKLHYITYITLFFFLLPHTCLVLGGFAEV